MTARKNELTPPQRDVLIMLKRGKEVAVGCINDKTLSALERRGFAKAEWKDYGVGEMAVRVARITPEGRAALRQS